MKESDARWDGQQWVSVDGRWVWSGSQWLQFVSNVPIAARMAIYASIGLVVNLPILFVLALLWGLQGPGWAANPPNVGASAVQIGLTLGGALVAFGASWFLTRVDRRDWWLGVVFAWPWIASAAGMIFIFLASQPQDVTALLISVCLLVFVAFPLAGSIVGRRRPLSTRVGSTRLERATEAIPTLLKALVKAAIDWG